MLAVELLDDMTLAARSDGLTYWKELIYIGNFRKETSSESLKFSVSESDIDQWVDIHGLFVERGIDVPLPKDHSFDVEDSRGSVLAMEKRKDSKGRIGLFGKIKFRDEEAAQLAKTAKVSIYVPPKYTDAQGNTYSHPIRHVALTDYPVINQLDGFIAASYIEGESKMPLKKLAASLGVKVKDDDDDAKISAAITAAFEDLKNKPPAKEEEETSSEEEDDAEMKKKREMEAAEKKKKAGDKPKSVSASMLSMLEENRTNKINKLVDDGKITPAVAKGLTEQFCGKKTLTLSLVEDGFDDGFTSMVKVLDQNEPVLLGEQTGGQHGRTVLKLSDEENPLLKNAESRAKSH